MESTCLHSQLLKRRSPGHGDRDNGCHLSSSSESISQTYRSVLNSSALNYRHPRFTSVQTGYTFSLSSNAIPTSPDVLECACCEAFLLALELKSLNLDSSHQLYCSRSSKFFFVFFCSFIVTRSGLVESGKREGWTECRSSKL